MERLLRQSDIIKLFIETAPVPMSEEQKEAFESGLVDMLKDIPSAEKQGEWIDIWEDARSAKAMCNNCKRESDRPLGNFCKWCGARMVK